MRKYITFLLNFPWTILGILSAIISIPRKITFSYNQLAIIFHVRSFWWYTWLPGKKGLRAITTGHIIQLSPYKLEGDLEHELIHVEQAAKEPFIHPFLYLWQSYKYGYRKNKYEVEAYSKTKSKYLE